MIPALAGGLFDETPEQATALIDAAVRDLQARGVPADGIVIDVQQAMLGAAIADQARSWDAELIVIGRRSRRLLGSMLRRRVSDQIMAEASCPVLVVRSRAG